MMGLIPKARAIIYRILSCFKESFLFSQLQSLECKDNKQIFRQFSETILNYDTIQ